METFLLPSLTNGFLWLATYCWEDHDNSDVLVKVLEKLIRVSISGQALTMHTAILGMYARHLENSLRHLRNREPSRQDIDGLLHALQSHSHSYRMFEITHEELETWTAVQSIGDARGAGIRLCVRSAIDSLVQWSSSLGMRSTPPNYTHKLLVAAVQVIGAPAVLEAILDEVSLQTNQCRGDLALDIASVIVIASASSGSGQSTAHRQATSQGQNLLNLVDALRLERARAAKLLASNAAKAETLVRLHRRVELQLRSARGAVIDASGIQMQMSGDIIDMNMEMGVPQMDLSMPTGNTPPEMQGHRQSIDTGNMVGEMSGMSGMDDANVEASGQSLEDMIAGAEGEDFFAGIDLDAEMTM